MKVLSTHDEVFHIMFTYPATRSNDKLLYYKVLEEFHPDTLAMAVGSYLLDRYSNVPSIETVGRCRRKIQEDYPDMRATEKVKHRRQRKEREFKEYAHGRSKVD